MPVLVRRAAAISLITGAFAFAPTLWAAEDAEGVLNRSLAAMGGKELKTLRFTGAGAGTTFGQAFVPGLAWPKINIDSYSRTVNYDTASLQDDIARSRAEVKGGGALPPSGSVRTISVVSAGHAWNMAGTNAIPTPAAVNDRVHDLWTTPHGVLMAARKNKATVDFHGKHAVVSFSEPGSYKAVVHINENYLVEKVESTLPGNVLGDTKVVTTYSEYRDINGIRFPMRIAQSMGGFPVMDLVVTDAAPNVAFAPEVPANVKSAVENVTTEKVAEGVWFVAGGSHNSVAIEMKDHMILVESPLGDHRAKPVFEAVRKLSPKPIRYVVNSHNHFDHSGGLRAAVAEGATIVAEKRAAQYFRKVFAQPNGIRKDALASAKKPAKFVEVSGSKVMTDGRRSVEIHHIAGNIHGDSMLMVWLPKERLLVEADAFTPPPAGTKPPAAVPAITTNLVENIGKLKLNVDRILPLHGRVIPASDLYAYAGRNP